MPGLLAVLRGPEFETSPQVARYKVMNTSDSKLWLSCFESWILCVIMTTLCCASAVSRDYSY